jgi:hypothetical protein
MRYRINPDLSKETLWVLDICYDSDHSFMVFRTESHLKRLLDSHVVEYWDEIMADPLPDLPLTQHHFSEYWDRAYAHAYKYYDYNKCILKGRRNGEFVFPTRFEPEGGDVELDVFPTRHEGYLHIMDRSLDYLENELDNIRIDIDLDADPEEVVSELNDYGWMDCIWWDMGRCDIE